MEEDELGTQREIGHIAYVPCARCGKMTLPSEMALVPSDALEENSEYDLLCPECQTALADGERELPLSQP